jgi:hypothetical protein
MSCADDEHTAVRYNGAWLVRDEPRLDVWEELEDLVRSNRIHCGEAWVQDDGKLQFF